MLKLKERVVSVPHDDKVIATRHGLEKWEELGMNFELEGTELYSALLN